MGSRAGCGPLKGRLAQMLGAVLVLAGPLVGVAPARAAARCADPAAKPGEWRSYGADLQNSRHQTAERVLNPSTVANVAPAWAFTPPDAGADGGFSNTPVVADGCVYLATDTGYVIALNADTGDVVWRSVKLPGGGQALLGGVIVGSPVVAGGMVFVGVSRPGSPYVAALDQATGAMLWTSVVEGAPIGFPQDNAFINASPVYVNGMIFMGFAGNEGEPQARGGFAIVDASRDCDSGPGVACASPVPGASGGRLLAHTYTISDAEYAAGYRGASVWCTAAADPASGYVYACGGNPASKRLESRYANALLKIDADPSRPTFGQIVDAYKGNVDQYYPGLDRQPACDLFGEQLVYVAWSLACLQLDLDFGASPNLFRDSMGRLLVGDLQKSGVYHAAYADNMQMAWTTVIAPPCFACNAASPAFDAERIYAVGSPGSVIHAFTKDSGRFRWASWAGEGTHYQPVSLANGVAYTIDNAGILHGYEAASGLPVLLRVLSQDVSQFRGPAAVSDASSNGVSIARNTIYVAAGEWVVAYR